MRKLSVEVTEQEMKVLEIFDKWGIIQTFSDSDLILICEEIIETLEEK